ncbi:hypothetical protein C8R45DRAFT_1165533 [Mycena sanguinolenta]|nr:hypothetical protein C8R45DRAFT_1165533 [Mycena sanguinolenta]
MAIFDQTPCPPRPAFENPCGRRGCAHIFKCGGTNPVQDLAVLVARHAPHCIGRIISATHGCDTEAMVDLLHRQECDHTTDLRLGDNNATDFPDSYAGSEASTADLYMSDDLYVSEGEMPLDGPDFKRTVAVESINAPAKFRRKLGNACVDATLAGVETPVVERAVSPDISSTVPSRRRKRAEDPEADVDVDTHDILVSSDGAFTVSISCGPPTKRRKTAASASAPKSKSRFHKPKPMPAPAATTAPPTIKKKGARTEAQRRAVLTNDPWTLTVGPQSVLCRGCRNTIQLDGRSRYYPGLWEKHRLRCEGVKKGLAEGDSSRSVSES